MRNALATSFLVLCVAGCQSPKGQQPAGPVVFFDAAGNRMVVDARAEPAQRDAPASGQSAPADDVAADLPASAFQGEQYVDAGDFQRKLDEREGQRFFIVPDGSGRRQTLEAAAIGAGTPAGPPPAEMPAPIAWQVCRIIMPLLPVKSARRYDLSFPATDKNEVVYGGFLLPAPPQTTRATVRSYVRSGTRAFPVLARVDAEGRVISIVNNMPTQSIPESGFRYASVGGTVSVAGSDRYALLDGSRLAGKLPATCGLQAADSVSTGLVTLQFSGSGEQ